MTLPKKLEEKRNELSNKHYNDNMNFYDTDGVPVAGVYEEGFNDCYKTMEPLLEALKKYMNHPELLRKYYGHDVILADVEEEYEFAKKALKDLGIE